VRACRAIAADGPAKGLLGEGFYNAGYRKKGGAHVPSALNAQSALLPSPVLGEKLRNRQYWMIPTVVNIILIPTGTKNCYKRKSIPILGNKGRAWIKIRLL
jgi:hypothetical protein